MFHLQKKYYLLFLQRGVTYNFAPANTDLEGKKFKLKFEGYGELHNLPGRVVNTCTGDVLGDM